MTDSTSRAEFEAEAIERLWAYRTDQGLWPFPNNNLEAAWQGWQAARTQPQQQAEPANRHIAAHMFIREREIDMSAREAALEQALRKIIRERDVYGWSPEVDEAIESARAALATTKDKL